MQDSRLNFLRMEHAAYVHGARKVRHSPEIAAILLNKAAACRRDIAGHKSLRKLGW